MRQGERGDERGHLEHIRGDGVHEGRSEPLREDQGEGEVAQQGDGHDEADDVLGTHSLSTPLAMRTTSANTATVVATKARSAIADS
ncbi:hypothetical protein GCM10027091_22090 [Streptomyces daliensis]